MRLKFILSILTILLAFPIPNFAQAPKNDDTEWYPFVIPEKLDPDSPINIGKLVLDAPAGKHGFCKVKDKHFYFEDGTRAKFWGTNLCFEACFPDKKQAKMLAERIAFFGFNAVRLHHMDFYFEPKGIFEDTCPGCKDPQMKKTTKLSKKQLDKLDYFIFQLKQRGIYVDMNLLVSRHFTEADGIKDAQKLGMAAKPASMFDPNLIALQKQYAKDLLTHFNPYTKLRYCDDPAVALVEITNENSIVSAWKNNRLNGTLFGYKKDALPPDHIKMLNELWNSWLISKYKTVDNLKSSWQSNVSMSDVRPSQSIISDQHNWTLEQHNSAKADIVSSPHQAVITITQTTDTDWHLQYRATNINLKKDTKYLLKFTAYSKSPTEIAAISQQAFSPWENLGLSENISLSSIAQEYFIPFIPNNDCLNAKIGFSIGKDATTITIQNISLEVVESSPLSQEELAKQDFSFSRPLYKILAFYPPQLQEDIKAFYTILESEYISKITRYLKDEIGVKVPITGIGGFSNQDNVITQESADFLDVHTYWDHPKFPNKPWDRNDFTIHNKSMLLDQKLGMVGSILSRVPSPRTKPFTVTEWNHCYPNQYAYESPLLLASKAHNEDWDGLFQFASSHGWEFAPSFDNVRSYFDTLANSQQLILDSIASQLYLFSNPPTITIEKDHYLITTSSFFAAVGFIKSKKITLGPFSFTPSENGAIILFSKDNKSFDQSKEFMILTVGEIKNKNSGWDKNGRFRWAQGPVITRRIHLEGLSHQSGKPFTITEEQNQPWQVIRLP